MGAPAVHPARPRAAEVVEITVPSSHPVRGNGGALAGADRLGSHTRPPQDPEYTVGISLFLNIRDENAGDETSGTPRGRSSVDLKRARLSAARSVDFVRQVEWVHAHGESEGRLRRDCATARTLHIDSNAIAPAVSQCDGHGQTLAYMYRCTCR